MIIAHVVEPRNQEEREERLLMDFEGSIGKKNINILTMFFL
jgi:hypothetical protein